MTTWISIYSIIMAHWSNHWKKQKHLIFNRKKAYGIQIEFYLSKKMKNQWRHACMQLLSLFFLLKYDFLFCFDLTLNWSTFCYAACIPPTFYIDVLCNVQLICSGFHSVKNLPGAVNRLLLSWTSGEWW